MRATALPQEHSRIRKVIEFLCWSAFAYFFGMRGSRWGLVPLVGLISFLVVEFGYGLRNMTAAQIPTELKDRSVPALGCAVIYVSIQLLRYAVVRGL